MVMVAPREACDAGVFLRARNGDEDACAVVYASYDQEMRGMWTQWRRQILIDDWDDVVIETWARAFRGLRAGGDDLLKPRVFRAYLHRILLNRAIDTLRSQRVRICALPMSRYVPLGLKIERGTTVDDPWEWVPAHAFSTTGTTASSDVAAYVADRLHAADAGARASEAIMRAMRAFPRGYAYWKRQRTTGTIYRLQAAEEGATLAKVKASAWRFIAALHKEFDAMGAVQ